MLSPEPHGHVHHHGPPGHHHHGPPGHGPAVDAPAVDASAAEQSFWLSAGQAYTGLRSSLQLLAGLQLLGVCAAAKADLRRAVLVQVKVILDEVRDQLAAISAPGSALPYLADLAACGESLREVASRQSAQLRPGAGPAEAAQTTRLLARATDRLRRCQRYDLGLRFFGSGGCADIDHALSHLRSGGSSHAGLQHLVARVRRDCRICAGQPAVPATGRAAADAVYLRRAQGPGPRCHGRRRA